MKSTHAALALFVLVPLATIDCRSSASDKSVSLAPSSAVELRFADLAFAFRSRNVTPQQRPFFPADVARRLDHGHQGGLFSRSTTSLDVEDGHIVATARGARALFSQSADGPLTLNVGHASVSLRMFGAQSTPAEFVKGHLMYPGASAAGGDVLVRATPLGFEDYVVVNSSSQRSIEYQIGLGETTKGLRLVEGTLELLDEEGAPRIRMQAPYIVDHNGVVRSLAVGLSGCAVDTNLAAPFHRPVTPPGASTCTLKIEWDPTGLAYPAVVDPAWMATGALNLGRELHSSVNLANGNVLVAGGLSFDPMGVESATGTTEIYSPTLGAWAMTGSLTYPRAQSGAAVLSNGDVLMAGGLEFDQTVLSTAEIYSPGTGMWTTTGSLARPRAGHSVTAVGDGTVLIAAGYDNSGVHFEDTELFSAGSFAFAGNTNISRFFQSAVALPNHRVLIGGGTDPYLGAAGSIEPYTAGIGWSPAPSLASMKTPRTLATAALLADGDVVFFGGYNATDGEIASAERYRPSTNTWTTGTGTLAHARFDAVATTLLDGRVLIVGGETNTVQFADGEIYDPATTAIDHFHGMKDERAFGHTANLLGDGRVLVAGGFDWSPPRILASTDIFDLAVDAGPSFHDAGAANADAGVSHDAAGGGAGDATIDAMASPDAAIPSDDAGEPSDVGAGEPVEDAARPDTGSPCGDIVSGAGCSSSHGANDASGLVGSAFTLAFLFRRRRRG